VTEMGNPYLMPMYMNAFNFTHTYKGKISNSITYNKIKNVYFDYTIQNDSTKETIGTITNLNGRDVLAYDIFIQQNVFKWWITTFNASCIYFKFSGEIYDQKFNVESYSYYAGINNQFIFPKKTKLELSAFYSGPWRNNVGIFESRYNVDMAIRKSFLSDKLNLVIGCSDIFFTSIFRGNVDYLNLHSRSVHTSDTRRLRFTLSYNFGKLKVQQRQVKSNDDESRRMNH
ncbi:MAG: outer membrane beta-barrel protein, partial [Bacteroidia bacterium]